MRGRSIGYTVGIAAAALASAAFIYALPDLIRYIRIERM
jgi:hypothetical protein